MKTEVVSGQDYLEYTADPNRFRNILITFTPIFKSFYVAIQLISHFICGGRQDVSLPDVLTGVFVRSEFPHNFRSIKFLPTNSSLPHSNPFKGSNRFSRHQRSRQFLYLEQSFHSPDYSIVVLNTPVINMVSTAFVPTLSHGCASFNSSWVTSSTSTALRFSSARRTGARNVYSVRVVARMSSEEPYTTDAKPVESSINTPESQTTPPIDSALFTDFVESTQIKISQFQQQVSEIDSEQVMNDTVSGSKTLIDNLFAGDWLNRGELYGGLQLLFILFLLQKPALDGFVSLVTGPLLLLMGAGISAKAATDLGFKQLSIWPAPVPNGEFRCDGMYGIMRHPMYAGLLLASAGFSIATGSPARLAVTAAMAFLLLKKIDVEEEFLLETYPEYQDYKRKVPHKIIPKLY